MPLDRETERNIKEKISEAERILKKWEPEVERAKMAGIDVSAQLKEIRELKTSIEKMKLVYGKGK